MCAVHCIQLCETLAIPRRHLLSHDLSAICYCICICLDTCYTRAWSFPCEFTFLLTSFREQNKCRVAWSLVIWIVHQSTHRTPFHFKVYERLLLNKWTNEMIELSYLLLTAHDSVNTEHLLKPEVRLVHNKIDNKTSEISVDFPVSFLISMESSSLTLLWMTFEGKLSKHKKPRCTRSSSGRRMNTYGSICSEQLLILQAEILLQECFSLIQLTRTTESSSIKNIPI